ncbi:MAG: 2-hydroxyacyl-CoA dehydratase [Actinobacteria bacterium]|nr:2-hydroxyacyl-CoA dehydratase [Actinomycetota bacterium]
MDEREMSWFCAYTPVELLAAAGFRPVRRFGYPHGLEAADTYLHPALCPYVRACLAEALNGDAPRHAVFVNCCDGMRRLHDAWGDLFPGSFSFLLDLPRNPGGRGREILKLEFHRLLRALEEYAGLTVEAEDLHRACRESSELRLSYIRAAEGKAGVARVELAQETQEYRFPLEVEENRGKEGGVPVLLTGNLLNPRGLVAFLERAGARVVWADLCNGDRPFTAESPVEGEDVPRMLESLAAHYLERHPCARMADGERRYRLLAERFKASGARGVIYASLKFCDSYLYDFPRLEVRLRREGIPLLRLESDYADGHAGQLLTRVEAFLEMIAGD